MSFAAKSVAWAEYRVAASDLSNLVFNYMQSREAVTLKKVEVAQLMEAVRRFDAASEKLTRLSNRKEFSS